MPNEPTNSGDGELAEIEGAVGAGDDAGDDLADDLRTEMERASEGVEPERDRGERDAKPERSTKPARRRSKAKVDEPPADAEQTAEPDDLRADLKEQLEATAAPASLPWLDTMLSPYQSELEQHGLTAQDAITRLIQAEQGLREDPAGWLERLASAYAARADVGTRADAAARLLKALGFTPNTLDQTAQARLQYFEQQNREREAEFVRTYQSLQGKLEAFVQRIGEPAFNTLQPLMLGFVKAGVASSFEDAYKLALRHHPELDPDQRQQAMAAQQAQARREHIAKAERAKTPRTASVPGEAPLDQSLRADLLDAFREQVGSGRGH